jgi:hypothetical protein
MPEALSHATIVDETDPERAESARVGLSDLSVS